jgi:DNA-binding NtrC family response regulator
VTLLRVLQQKEVEPVGAGKSVKINVRIISATNRDLGAEVTAGRFREDLYFRLNVLPIEVPPLRVRGSDIAILARHFIERFAASDGLPLKQLTPDASAYLAQHAWAGNVRELENTIHRALVLYDSDSIDRSQLALLQSDAPAFAPTPTNTPDARASLSLTLQHPDGRFKTADEIEAEAMQRVLDHYDQNITRAADALGIAKSTFYRKRKDAP